MLQRFLTGEGADYSYQTDETYTYDETGNRTNAGYTTGANNRLDAGRDRLGTDFTYLYDDEGNRTQRTNVSTGDVVEYTWDHRNRLTKVTFKNNVGTVTKGDNRRPEVDLPMRRRGRPAFNSFADSRDGRRRNHIEGTSIHPKEVVATFACREACFPGPDRTRDMRVPVLRRSSHLPRDRLRFHPQCPPRPQGSTTTTAFQVPRSHNGKSSRRQRWFGEAEPCRSATRQQIVWWSKGEDVRLPRKTT